MPQTDDPETEGRDGHPRDGWRRRVAQTDAPGRKSLDFHGFSYQGHPSVPLVLALPVSETDGAETYVPETEEGRPRRMSPRRRKAARNGCRRDGCPRDGRCVFLKALCQVLVNVTDCFFRFSFADECMGQAILSVWFSSFCFVRCFFSGSFLGLLLSGSVVVGTL